MNLNEYQSAAMTTAKYPKDKGLDYTILGLCGEAGELANLRKKHIRKPCTYPLAIQAGLDEETERRTALADELGDVLWYAAAVAHELGFDLETVARMNLEKLRGRAEAGTLTEIER